MLHVMLTFDKSQKSHICEFQWIVKNFLCNLVYLSAKVRQDNFSLINWPSYLIHQLTHGDWLFSKFLQQKDITLNF